MQSRSLGVLRARRGCAYPTVEHVNLWRRLALEHGAGGRARNKNRWGKTNMALVITSLDIADVKLLQPPKFGDHRGFFSEVYNEKAFADGGVHIAFVQDNHSLSGEKGTVRGLHFQSPPFAQDKLVRVVRGAIFDIAVDLRRSSPTYGKHVSAILSADAWNQLLVPIGFAHGFMTLEPNTEVIYKVSNYYSPTHDHGLLWNDPALGIEWPLPHEQAVLSDKDRKQPLFAGLASPFA